MRQEEEAKLTVVNVMATSLDGKISEFPEQTDQERAQYGFSSDEDRDFVKAQIFSADAVILGSRTLRASGKFWSLRNRWGRFPVWAVYSNSPQSIERILSQQTEIPKILISQNELEMGNFLPEVEKISYRDASPGKFLLDYLRHKKYIKNVVLFGGGTINRIFYEEGLVDELKLTISPFIFAGKDSSALVDPGLSSKVRLSWKSSQVVNNHVFLSYTVQKR